MARPPMPPMSHSLHFVLSGDTDSFPSARQVLDDHINMVHKAPVIISTNPSSGYGWTYQGVSDHKQGRHNAADSRTPARDRLIQFRSEMKLANPNVLVGFYKGLRTTRTPAMADAERRYPPENVFTSDLDGDYTRTWPNPAPEFPHDKQITLQKWPDALAPVTELFATILSGGYGHPKLDLVHLDQMAMSDEADGAWTWVKAKQLTAAIRNAAISSDVYLSVNVGGWNCHSNPTLVQGLTKEQARIDLVPMSDYFQFEQVPLPGGGATLPANYIEVLTTFRHLLTNNRGIELIPAVHLHGDNDAIKYTITNVQVYLETVGVPDMNYHGLQNFFPTEAGVGQKKVLLTLDRNCQSCNPTLGAAPWERFRIGKRYNTAGTPNPANVVGVPWGNWSAWPGPTANTMYLFRRGHTIDAALNAIRTNPEAAFGEDLDANATFQWSHLIGQPFYDTTYYERMQAATLLFATPSMSKSAGVHYAIQSLHPKNLAESFGQPNMDWRLWGQKLGEPVGEYSIVGGSATTPFSHISRVFENGVLVWVVSTGAFSITLT